MNIATTTTIIRSFQVAGAQAWGSGHLPTHRQPLNGAGVPTYWHRGGKAVP